MTASKGIHTSRTFAVHTVESLLANADDEGECLVWRGPCCNGVPSVVHNKQRYPVRRLLLILSGELVSSDYQYGCSCMNSLCVSMGHIQRRTPKQQSRLMNSIADKQSLVRRMKLSVFARANRAKINLDIAREIRLSTDTHPVLAARYGVNRATIGKIKRNETWRDFSTPFAGLGAR